MKTSIAALVILFSFNSLATIIHTYKGKTYSVNNTQSCQENFKAVSQNLEAMSEFLIVDGGCVSLNDKYVQVKFTYHGSDMEQIETYSREFSSAEKCEQMAKVALTELPKANLSHIDSFCSGTDLSVNFVDLKGILLQENITEFYYTDRAACENVMIELEKKLNLNNVRMPFSECEKITYDRTNTIYIPRMTFASHFTNHIGILRGKEFNLTENCSKDDQTVESEFEHANLKFMYGVCAKEHKSGSANLKEFIVYVSTAKSEHVEEFKGTSYINETQCEEQLIEANKKLEKLGLKTIYKFCYRVTHNLFIPHIYYTK